MDKIIVSFDEVAEGTETPKGEGDGSWTRDRFQPSPRRVSSMLPWESKKNPTQKQPLNIVGNNIDIPHLVLDFLFFTTKNLKKMMIKATGVPTRAV